MWRPSRWCGDDMGMTGTMWGQRGQHEETMETTDHGDHMGTSWGLWWWCEDDGDDGDDVEMMWGRRGDNRDDVGMTRGWRGPHGDNKITKNAITFERIEIIEFRLKIWDPWALLHTCRLQLMCRWGVFYPKWHFYPKSAPVTLEKIFSCFCTGSH